MYILGKEPVGTAFANRSQLGAVPVRMKFLHASELKRILEGVGSVIAVKAISLGSMIDTEFARVVT